MAARLTGQSISDGRAGRTSQLDGATRPIVQIPSSVFLSAPYRDAVVVEPGAAVE
jgi:hypothetical protein